MNKTEETIKPKEWQLEQPSQSEVEKLRQSLSSGTLEDIVANRKPQRPRKMNQQVADS